MKGRNPTFKPDVPLFLLLLFVCFILIIIIPVTAYSSLQEVGVGDSSDDGNFVGNPDVDTNIGESSGLESEPESESATPELGLVQPEPPVDDGPPVCIDVFPPPPGCDSDDNNKQPPDDGPPVCIDIFPPPPDCRIELPPEPTTDDGPPVCIDVFPPPPGCSELPPPGPPPDDDCLFDPSLPKCSPPDNGKCPDGFLMNENGQCFPDKPCPPGYTKIDDDETGTCHPADEKVTEINIIIVNEINRQVTTTTTPTTCTPQDKTVPLGPSTIANNGIRLLATFDPCRLIDGDAILNLPDSNGELKLVAVDLDGRQTHKAVVVDLHEVQQVANDQTLYNADFTGTITGLSAATNKMDTIRDVNALVLWNDSSGQLNFVDDNSVTLNALVLTR